MTSFPRRLLSFISFSQLVHRYRLRGVRNIIFYGAPEHGQFYSEFLTFPFLDEGVEPSDVTVKLLYSKYDMMRIERIVGTNAVDALVR